MKYSNKSLKTAIITGIVSIFLTIPAFATVSTDAKLQYNKGVDYWKLGQLEQSVSCFKNAIDLDPNYIDAYYNLGLLLQYLKQEEEALTVFKQIMIRKPDDYEAAYKAAELSKSLGQNDKAKMYLDLIPKDTLVGDKANKLASTLKSTTVEQEKPKQQESAPPVTQKEELNENEIQNVASPTGLVTDGEGNIFVAGFSDNTIYKIGTNNQKIVYIKDPKIDGPIGMAIDSEGNIYLANYNKNNVLKITKTGIITEFAKNIQKPYCMYISNNILYVSAQGSNSILKYKL